MATTSIYWSSQLDSSDQQYSLLVIIIILFVKKVVSRVGDQIINSNNTIHIIHRI